jgi:hypothetical protein
MTGKEKHVRAAIDSVSLRPTTENHYKGGSMVCDKCGFGYMIDDSYFDVKVFKCWVCGNRLYIDYPRRWGSLVCSRCGNDMTEENELGYCRECMKLLNVHMGRLKGRTYGESVCACGTTFVRKSPTQMFHSKDCRKRVVSTF